MRNAFARFDASRGALNLSTSIPGGIPQRASLSMSIHASQRASQGREPASSIMLIEE